MDARGVLLRGRRDVPLEWHIAVRIHHLGYACGALLRTSEDFSGTRRVHHLSGVACFSAVRGASVHRVSRLLLDLGGTRTLVQSYPAISLHLCAGKILEQRVYAVLDASAAAELPHLRTCPGASPGVLRAPHQARTYTTSTSPLIIANAHKQNQVIAVDNRLAFAVPVPISSATRHPRIYIYPHALVYGTHPDRPAACGVDAVHLLGRCVATGRAAVVGKAMGNLECCMGSCLGRPVGNIHASSMIRGALWENFATRSDATGS